MQCLHCGHRKASHGKRGLCLFHYQMPSVRALYPRKTPDRTKETAEELDALVAERMAKLPKWWNKDCPQGRGEKRLPQAVARGLGIQSRGERRRVG